MVLFKTWFGEKDQKN